MTEEDQKNDQSGKEAPQEIAIEIERQVKSHLPKQFQDLPETIKQQVVREITEATVSISHSTWDGSYPPPNIVSGYEAIQPGLGDRIFKMAESDLNHRHYMETKLASYMSAGQWFGFIIALTAVIGSIILIYSDKQLAGGILGAAVILPLVTLFVTGQISSNKRDNVDDRQSQPRRHSPRKKQKSGR